ncbi:branched-chain amino acid ABC transporter permease [Propionicimonas sp.]|uniref:branched-chain amino acid ABC transporter permease n=1 Tax=Propionicimonas sp. TaxID=1955623 RepID=UPI0017FB69BB|nr:branched-chain amino acid ABC transporter permease [Propionicimonas sp.]MBU3976019.1 branched-chain amino acid ABC transporter permease [Actinomycetota bacterium]MBA3020833.1 branched-chain amino acid ABC transporter permease [Propionicimonas sp.]MBU3985209.1 branched-chain amino acid ABC transporter permease [Actinomycetota bacterium]MBU4008199.1 branched-chain amino acid ABC transporter permease [Actinomycetota bacterium]MBU4064587.1 branched-chain amino acid ABC transporter permease [Act
MELFFQQLINGLSLGALYALIAVGYTVVYGIVQLINFAHGEIFMIGAFGAFATWTVMGRPADWPATTALLVLLPLMMIGGMVAAIAVAVATERFAYRPLRGAPRLAPLISAIGVSVFLQELIRLFFGTNPFIPSSSWPVRIPGWPDAKSAVPFPSVTGISGEIISIGGVTIQMPAVFTLGALAICTVFLWYFVNRTKTGRAMVATSQDPDTARLMGINVDRVIVSAFAVGAALAAIAGVAHGLRYGNIDFRMGFLAGLKAFTAAVLGGIGNINGAVVGGLVLGVAEAMATTFIPGQFGSSAWKDVWAFVLLIMVLVFRPQGLLGAKVVDRA